MMHFSIIIVLLLESRYVVWFPLRQLSTRDQRTRMKIIGKIQNDQWKTTFQHRYCNILCICILQKSLSGVFIFVTRVTPCRGHGNTSRASIHSYVWSCKLSHVYNSCKISIKLIGLYQQCLGQVKTSVPIFIFKRVMPLGNVNFLESFT